MKFQKKGQFLIFSALFLFLLLYFIYSLETVNTYKFENGDFIYINEYKDKICTPLISRNGTVLNSTILLIENSIASYCSYAEIDCNFDIYNITPIPPSGNWSLLTMDQFNISFDFNGSYTQVTNTFNCT
jgi:hypothetical protein